MADIAELRVRITADTSGFKTALVDAQATVQKTGGVFASLRDSITPINQGIELLKTAFSGLTTIANSLASALAAPIKAAQDQDVATAKLEATLQSTNQLTAEYANTLNDLADAEALVKNVQDDVVASAERTLIAFGAQREEIPRLIDAVLDLSTKTGDVGQAAFLVGKAMTGQTESLGRYGIKVDEAASKTEKFESALQQIQRLFGGQAAAAAATFSGRVGIIGIAFSQLQERIGQVVTQNAAVLTVLSGISLGFVRAKEAIEVFLGPLDDVITGLAALGAVKAAEGLEAIADATADFPIISETIRAFASGLRDANTAVLQAKGNLGDVSRQVKEGEARFSNLTTIVKTVGSTGQFIFRTLGTGLETVNKGLKTFTDRLNDADNKLDPLTNLAESFGIDLPAKLKSVEDQFVAFATSVGLKMGKAMARALVDGLNQSIDIAAAIAAEQAKTFVNLDRSADQTLAKWAELGRKILEALSPATAGAADIPEIKVPPINVTATTTSADANIATTQAKAERPLKTTYELDTTAANTTADTFFDKLIAGWGKVATAAAKGFGAFGATPAATAGAASPPSGTKFDAAQDATNRALIKAALDRAEAEKASNAATAAGTKLKEQQLAASKALAAQNATAAKGDEAELARLRKGFEELNRIKLDATKGGVTTATVDLNTAPALTKAKSFEEEMAGFKALNPTVTPQFNTAPANTQIATYEARLGQVDEQEVTSTATLVVPPASEAEAKAFEDRVRRLDGLRATTEVDITVPKGATLQDMIDKANEINGLRPNLNVAAGQSFQDSQASIARLRADILRLQDEKVTIPPVDTTQAEASVTSGVSRVKATTAQPVLLKIAVDESLDPATKVITDFAAQIAEPKVLRVDTTQLAPATEALTNFQTVANTPVAPQVDETGFIGSFLKMETAVKDFSEESKQAFHFTADITNIEEKIGIIRADIAVGVDPITIDGEISKLREKIAQAKKEIESLSGQAKIDAQVRLDKDQAELDNLALKNNVEEPATKPVKLDTAQADAQAAALEAQIKQIEANVANVARGGGRIIGNAASREDLENTVAQAAKDIAAAIAAGDQARLAELFAGLREFRASFGLFRGQSTIPTNIAQALNVLQGGFSSLGGFQASPGNIFGGGLAGQVAAELAGAQAIANQKAQEAIQKAQEANDLLRENNDIARANLDATRGLGGALSSGRFAQGITTGITRTQASNLGRPTVRIGA